MTMLVSGLLVWSIVHLFPSVAPRRRKQFGSRLGEPGYQGVFSLLIICALLMIVFGWRATVPYQLFNPVAELRYPAILLVVIGFVLMAAANFPSRLKRAVRHPQLTGVMCWAFAHLLLNGDNRSVLVFATLCVWSIISVLTINRRDGAWEKPDRPSGWGREIIVVAAGLALTLVTVSFHHYLSGVSLIG